MNLLSFISKILDYIYYRKCYICSKKCLEISICEDCLDKIFSDLLFCKTTRFGVDIYTATIYETEILKIIRALKYHKKREFEKLLSDIIIKTIKNYDLDIKDYIICPVPISENRLKKRKYNHMELVGNSVAKEFNLEIKPEYLKRVKDTAPLYKIPVPEREKTINGAFEVSDEIKGKKVLLIDDIITSGTTIKELTKLITEKEPEKLLVLCATRSKSFI